MQCSITRVTCCSAASSMGLPVLLVMDRVRVRGLYRVAALISLPGDSIVGLYVQLIETNWC